MICEKATRKYPDGRTGTSAGYQAHKANDEIPCQACLDGHRTYHRQLKAANPERGRTYYEENKERVRARQAERADEIREYQREYYQKNKAKLQEYGREYYQKNKNKPLDENRHQVDTKEQAKRKKVDKYIRGFREKHG